MENKLSLSKKLDGGYLHVKRSKTSSYKKSRGYSAYLNKQVGGLGESLAKIQRWEGNEI